MSLLDLCHLHYDAHYKQNLRVDLQRILACISTPLCPYPPSAKILNPKKGGTVNVVSNHVPPAHQRLRALSALVHKRA